MPDFIQAFERRGGMDHHSLRILPFTIERPGVKRVSFLAVTFAALLIASPAAVMLGTTHIDLADTLRVIGAKLLPWVSMGDVSKADQIIIWVVRLPRVIVAGFVGAGLAVAGALMQGLFRNPMAETNILGVGSGAGLGALIVFLSGLTSKSVLVLPVAAFIGALLALVAVYSLATRGGVTPVSTLLLSGIAFGALLASISTLLISLNIVSWAVAQEVIFWLWMGGLENRSWTHVWVSIPFIGLAICVGLYYSRDLDLMVQGEDTAAALGVDVESTKRVLMVTAALISGSAVAVAGAIGFVGLIVPHIARIFVGPGHRLVLPASALAGSAFLILCDLVARTVHPSEEIRLGIVTSLMGAPLFFYLLVRRYQQLN
jgi:iron complex transport system permease protein